MSPPEPRVVTLVLCTPQGGVLGSLPPFQAEVPWWQEVRGIVRRVSDRYGVDVTVLRILEAERACPPGGSVTYLAELAGQPPPELPLVPWPGVLDEHRLRLPYARPGGPADDLAWAGDAMAARGLTQSAPAEQVRTWNLSSLWRIPAEGGNVWLKCVPPFFAHEGAVLAVLQDAPVPRLLAHQRGRVLVAEIPGEDQYGAGLPTLVALVSMLVDLQVRWSGRAEELLAIGLPDWRAEELAAAIDSVVRRTARELTAEERLALDEFVTGLPARFAALESCGIPDSLVHGDFSPGNARGHDDDLVLLDWGDCGVGNPLLDRAAFLDRIQPELIAEVREHWDRAWQTARPGSDPKRAARILAPVAAARQAVIYQAFLDQIEPSERPYHRADPAEWLSRTATIARAETDE